MENLCKLFGKSRQAWYQGRREVFNRAMEEELVLAEIRKIRADLPRIGTFKLHFMLQNFLNQAQIKMGRNAINELLRSRNMLVSRKKRRKIRTTYSLSGWLNYYPNLMERNFEEPQLAWVADITYISAGAKFSYLSLITDVYSHLIVGWALYKTLEAEGPLMALKMAIKQYEKGSEPLLHHSDRGIQYYSHRYRKLLKKNKMEISMTQNGDPYENAMAERVNGIIKDEMLEGRGFPNHELALVAIEKAINAYNNIRPHKSCDLLTPAQAHLVKGVLKKHWKKKSFKVPDSLAPTLEELHQEVNETTEKKDL